jgi:DNA-binding HxlR family transcriptional regulator
MTDAEWTLVINRQGVTIANDRFQLTANEVRAGDALFDIDDAVLAVNESSHMESIVAELHAMTRRRYGQYCGLARAMEVLGERWAFLVVRNLLVSPQRFADLHRGLPRIPTEVLYDRLKILEHNGVVRRQQARPDGAEVYELTDYGRELDKITLELGVWGARMLDKPRPEDIVTSDGLIIALRAAFQPEAAHGVRVGFELRIRDIVLHAVVDNSAIRAGAGPLAGADLVVETGMALRGLLSGAVTPAEALSTGEVTVIGDPALLELFVTLFHVPG